VLDLDYEDFFVVAHEDGAAAIGREDSPNLDWHDVVLHTDSLLRELKKTSTAKGQGALSQRAVLKPATEAAQLP
jgi:hypothetical protein